MSSLARTLYQSERFFALIYKKFSYRNTKSRPRPLKGARPASLLYGGGNSAAIFAVPDAADTVVEVGDLSGGAQFVRQIDH